MENLPAKTENAQATMLKALKNSPETYLKEMQATNLEQAIKAPTPGLSAIRKANSEPFTLSLITLLIIDLVRFFAVGKSMNDKMVADTAKLILERFYWLKPEDLKLCFNNIKCGQYGQTYDRMDGQVILLALDAYCNERAATAEAISPEKHKEAIAAPEELFVLRTRRGYIQRDQLDFYEVEKREDATEMRYSEAANIRLWITKTEKESIVIERANKPLQSIMDYIRINAPQLLSTDIIYNDKMAAYKQKLAEINSREDLSEFEKYNLRRELAGLEKSNEAEFLEASKWLNRNV